MNVCLVLWCSSRSSHCRNGSVFFFVQAEDGIRGGTVTGVQTCALPIFRRSRNNTLALEDMDDGGGIEAAGPAKENRALQQAHVGFGKQAVATLRTLRCDQPQGLPSAQR